MNGTYGILFMCDLLSLPRSAFSEFTSRTPSPAAAHRDALTVRVSEVFWAHKRCCGARRIARELARADTPAADGTVGEITRTEGRRTVQPRAWKRTTIHTPGLLDRGDGKRIFDTGTPRSAFGTGQD